MPIINTTPDIAAGLGAAGKYIEGRNVGRENARREDEFRLRRRAAVQEMNERKRQQALAGQSREARLEWLQRRSMQETARQLMQQPVDLGQVDTPLLEDAVGAKLRGSVKSSNQAISRRMKDLRELMSRMSPEDAERTYDESTADMRAEFLRGEQARVLRQIEDAAEIGVFGDDESAVATVTNIQEMARRDPARAAAMVAAQRKVASAKLAKARTRERVAMNAGKWLQLADTMQDVDERAKIEAEAMLSDFQVNPDADPEEFQKSFRARLFGGGPPKIDVVGLQRPVEDRSNWSKGGYIEDMNPRQRGELLSVARELVNIELRARKDVSEMAALLGGGEVPTGASEVSAADRQQMIEATFGDLLLTYGWRHAPDDEMFRRKWAQIDEVMSDPAQRAAAGSRIEQGVGAYKRQMERTASADKLPKWPDIEKGSPELAERARQTVVDMVNSGASAEDIEDAVIEMGVNPYTMPPDAIEKWSPKAPEDVESDELRQATMRRDQLANYPLATDEQRAQAERDIGLAQERIAGRKRSQQEAQQAIQDWRQTGYTGEAPNGPVELEVYVRWLEQQADEDLKRRAKLIRQNMKNAESKGWSDDELMRKYAERSRTRKTPMRGFSP